MPNELDSRISQYQKNIKELQSRLSSIRTAPSTEPTSEEISTNLSLLQAQNAVSELRGFKAKEGMAYSQVEQPKESRGYLGRALDVLGMPLYSIVGGVEAILGKGTKKGLANIPSNIRERGTFGDLLRKYNVTNGAAVPIGFMLDVFADPVNWATAGVGATIPRVARGIQKAGLKGAKLGLESSILGRMGARVGEAVGKLPGLRKVEQLKGLKDKAREASKLYNEAIGRDILKVLKEEPTTRKAATAIGETLKKTQKGRSFIENFKYDPTKWFRNIIREARLKKEFVKKLGEKGIDIESETNLRSLANTLDIGKDRVDEFVKNPKKIITNKTSRIIDEGTDLATDYSDLARGRSAEENGMRLAGEAKIEEEMRDLLDNYRKQYEEFASKTGKLPPGKTGIGFYDNFWGKFRDYFKVNEKYQGVGKNIAESYKDFIFLFKSAKIGGSPSSWVNAILGNPTMALMSGLNITDPQYFKFIKAGFDVTRGKITPEIQSLIKTTDWMTLMNNAPDVVRQVWGVNPNVLMNEDFIKDITRKYLESQGTLKKYTDKIDEDALSLGNMAREMLSKGKLPGVKKALGTPQEIFRKIGEGEGLTTSFISSELGTPRLMKYIEANKEKNIAAKAMHWYLTKPLEGYEKIDQSYKIGTSLYLTSVGVTESELLNLRKFVKFSNQDVERLKTLYKNGRYRLPADKALEVVNDMYMSYAAMPAAIKVFRQLPFMGNSFASFGYGMATKTGKALAYNPEIFNQIQFLLNEINGGKSPLERKALQSKYYQWLNRDGMVRFPFFEQNPVYMNLANMIPYYSMNIFETRGRNYEEKLGGTIARIFDGLPIMKTPEGQLLFDYFIQPLILKETNPVGAFNQQLWPLDATGLEKASYALRQGIESVIPTAVAIPLAAITPEKFIELIPLYRSRQIAYAARGKTSSGIPASEPAFQRSARAIAATYAGISLYPVNVLYSK